MILAPSRRIKYLAADDTYRQGRCRLPGTLVPASQGVTFRYLGGLGGSIFGAFVDVVYTKTG